MSSRGLPRCSVRAVSTALRYSCTLSTDSAASGRSAAYSGSAAPVVRHERQVEGRLLELVDDVVGDLDQVAVGLRALRVARLGARGVDQLVGAVLPRLGALRVALEHLGRAGCRRVEERVADAARDLEREGRVLGGDVEHALLGGAEVAHQLGAHLVAHQPLGAPALQPLRAGRA